MGVFISYYVTPIWVSIGCNDSLDNNYFLCEIDGRLSSAISETIPDLDVERHYVCRSGLIYVDRLCWAISTRSKFSEVKLYNRKLSSLNTLLCAWSIGMSLRNIIAIPFVDGKGLKCLKTTDHYYQRFKKWNIQEDCNPTFQLIPHIPSVYHNQCKGINTQFDEISSTC